MTRLRTRRQKLLIEAADRLAARDARKPDISGHFRSEMRRHLQTSRRSWAPADLDRHVDELMAFADREGNRIRLDTRQARIDRLRAELVTRAKEGRYPGTKWRRLRELEAEQEVDRRRTARRSTR